jgi:predicted transport protein
VIVQNIEEIIRLRERAIQELLDERARVEAELRSLTTREREISERLVRLGHHDSPSVTGLSQQAGARKQKPGLAAHQEPSEYTLEQHLIGRTPAIAGLLHGLSDAIRALGADVQEVPRRHMVVYRTTANFCSLVIQASKLVVYVDIPVSELLDPLGKAEDCSQIGRWATGETRVNVKTQEEVDYAMSLIRQAYKRSH